MGIGRMQPVLKVEPHTGGVSAQPFAPQLGDQIDDAIPRTIRRRRFVGVRRTTVTRQDWQRQRHGIAHGTE